MQQQQPQQQQQQQQIHIPQFQFQKQPQQQQQQPPQPRPYSPQPPHLPPPGLGNFTHPMSTMPHLPHKQQQPQVLVGVSPVLPGQKWGQQSGQQLLQPGTPSPVIQMIGKSASSSSMASTASVVSNSGGGLATSHSQGDVRLTQNSTNNAWPHSPNTINAQPGQQQQPRAPQQAPPPALSQTDNNNNNASNSSPSTTPAIAVQASAATPVSTAMAPPAAATAGAAPGAKPYKAAPSAHIYGAVYSGVPVFEMMCKNVAIMRRRADSYLNATQILKVAGVEKGKRTKILEREILAGDHEKVQGGYGKYQGTWIPFHRGVQLAKMFEVDKLMKPLLDFEPPPPGRADTTPTKEQVMGIPPKRVPGEAAARRREQAAEGMARRPKRNLDAKMPGREENASNPGLSDASSPPPDEEDDSPPWSPGGTSQLKKRARITADEYYSQNGAFGELAGSQQLNQSLEKQRAFLMAIFLNDDPNHVPDFLTSDSSVMEVTGPDGKPGNIDIDLVIDHQGHTSLHWAAALARINILKLLIAKGASVRKTNYAGESALVRAVLVTNNYDSHTFKALLPLLNDCINLVDNKNRTILHHITLTAGIKGRVQASRYYLECLFEWLASTGGEFSQIVDIRDKNGDTALNVAARIGNRSLVEMLLDVGANSDIENMAGLKPSDFGFEDIWQNHSCLGAPSVPQLMNGDAVMSEQVAHSTTNTRVAFPAVGGSDTVGTVVKKGREVADTIQRMVSEMNTAYTSELQAKQDQLIDAQAALRDVTRELSEVRKQNQALRLRTSRLPDLTVKVRNLERALRDEIARGIERERAARELNSLGIVPIGGSGTISSTASPVPALKPLPAAGVASSASPALAGTTVPIGAMAASAAGPTLNGQDETQRLTQAVQRLETHLAAKFADEAALREEIALLKSAQAKEAVNGDNSNTADGRNISRHEYLCRRIIAACINVPVENLDELLDPLLSAVESDDNDLDLSSISNLMNNAVNAA